MPDRSFGNFWWQMLPKRRLGVYTALNAEKRVEYLVDAFYSLMPRLAFQSISFDCEFSERTDLGNGNLYTRGYK
jgi:hypothetical protein